MDEFTALNEDETINREKFEASNLVGEETKKLIRFMQAIHPELTISEACLVTAYFLSNMPRTITINPPLVEAIKEVVEYVKNCETKNA